MRTKKKTKPRVTKVKPAKLAELEATAAMMREQLAQLAENNRESHRRSFRESLFFQALNEGAKPVEAATRVAMTANDLWARLHASESAPPEIAPIVESAPVAVPPPAPTAPARPPEVIS